MGEAVSAVSRKRASPEEQSKEDESYVSESDPHHENQSEESGAEEGEVKGKAIKFIPASALLAREIHPAFKILKPAQELVATCGFCKAECSFLPHRLDPVQWSYSNGTLVIRCCYNECPGKLVLKKE